MICETRVSVAFKQPVRLPDIHDGQLFLSDKHWIVAAYCERVDDETVFLSYDGEVLVRIPTELIETIKFQSLPKNSAIVTTKNNRDYRNTVRAVKKAQWSRWSVDEDIELIMRAQRGYSIQTLSVLHNRSEWAIWSRLVYLGKEQGYEAPERGVKLPQEIELNDHQVRNLDNPICLNCGFNLESPPCDCWGKSHFGRNEKLRRFQNDN